MTLASGRRIAAGERVSLWFLPANADAGEFGPAADRFDPLRDVAKRSPWGLAFGQGAHLCIGKNLITGVRARRNVEGGDAAYGAIATVARALFDAGMAIDRSRLATKHPTSIYDEYTSRPVLFSRF